MYKPRHMDILLKKYLDNFPAILVEGAKAVGKTSSCEKIANTVYYLDDENQFQVISNSPESILDNVPPVLIDEWQKFPPIWEKTRRMVDHGMPAGTLLLTGSSPSLHSRLHSGAGRLVSIKMRPFTIQERGMSIAPISLFELLENPKLKISGNSEQKLPEYLDEILKSGFPGIRGQKEFVRKELLKGYVNNIVNREFRENGYDIRKPELLHQWLTSYAAAISTLTSFQTILEASSKGESNTLSPNTASTYREMLLGIGVIEELPSWTDFGKLFPALTKSTKHFLLDPALLSPLLGITKEKLMKGNVPHPIGKLNKTFIGQLFECFVYQSLATYAEIKQLKLSYLRLRQGKREIDFLLEDMENNRILAIEVKAASTVRDEDVKHLNWFEHTTAEEFDVIRLIVYMGQYAYTRKDGVHVIPAALLGI